MITCLYKNSNYSNKDFFTLDTDSELEDRFMVQASINDLREYDHPNIFDLHLMKFDGKVEFEVFGKIPSVDDFCFMDSIDFIKQKYKVTERDKEYYND